MVAINHSAQSVPLFLINHPLKSRVGKVRSGLSEIHGSSFNFISFSFVAKHEFLWHRPHQLMPRSESRR